KLFGNLIETQGRNRDAIVHRAQALEDFAYLRVIAHGGRNQTDLVGFPAPFSGLRENVSRGHHARRPVVITCPAKSATLRTAARNLNQKSIAHLGLRREDGG